MIGWSPVALAGMLALAESLPGVGMFLPGEIMITALATSVPGVHTPLLGLAVVVGAGVGDQLNYWLGRLMGPRLSTSMAFRKLGRARWDRALDLIDRHGARAVLLSRLIPVVRAIVPAVAGAASLSPARFTVASVAGSVAWAIVWVGAGAVAGSLSAWSLSFVIFGTGVLLLGRRWLRRSRAASTAAALTGTDRTGNPTPNAGDATPGAQDGARAQRSARCTAMAASIASTPAATIPAGTPPRVCRPRSARLAWLERTEPLLWWDRAEPALWLDSSEAADIADPIEPADANEPTLANDATEAALPTERTES